MGCMSCVDIIFIYKTVRPIKHLESMKRPGSSTMIEYILTVAPTEGARPMCHDAGCTACLIFIKLILHVKLIKILLLSFSLHYELHSN